MPTDACIYFYDSKGLRLSASLYARPVLRVLILRGSVPCPTSGERAVRDIAKRNPPDKPNPSAAGGPPSPHVVDKQARRPRDSIFEQYVRQIVAY